MPVYLDAINTELDSREINQTTDWKDRRHRTSYTERPKQVQFGWGQLGMITSGRRINDDYTHAYARRLTPRENSLPFLQCFSMSPPAVFILLQIHDYCQKDYRVIGLPRSLIISMDCARESLLKVVSPQKIL